MLFLDCNMDVGVLKVVMFVKQLLNILFIAVPIGLIVMLIVDLAKNVLAGKEDEQKKNLQIALKRVVYAVILFFIPYVVNLAMIIVDEVLESLDISSKFTSCYNIEPDEVKQLAKTQCTDKGGVYDATTEVCETKNVPESTGKKINANKKKGKEFCQEPVVLKAIEQKGATKVCFYYNHESQKSSDSETATNYYAWIEFNPEGKVVFEGKGSSEIEREELTIEDMKKQQEKEDGTAKEWGDLYISGPAIRSVIKKQCPKYMYIDAVRDASLCVANSSGLSNSYCEDSQSTDGQDTFTIYPLEAACKP